MSDTNIDRAIHLVKLAQLHNSYSFDLDSGIHHIIIECKDLNYLAEHLTPLLISSIQNIQSFRLQLRSIQRPARKTIDKTNHL